MRVALLKKVNRGDVTEKKRGGVVSYASIWGEIPGRRRNSQGKSSKARASPGLRDCRATHVAQVE